MSPRQSWEQTLPPHQNSWVDFRLWLGLCPRPRHFFRHGSDVPKLSQKTRPWPGIPGPRPDTPWAHRRPGYPSAGCLPVGRQACQQSPPAGRHGLRPFYPAQQFDPQIQPPCSLLGHRCHALKMPGVWGQSPQSFSKSYPRILVRNQKRRGVIERCATFNVQDLQDARHAPSASSTSEGS